MSGTDVVQRTPAQSLVAAIRDDERVRDQLAAALPPDVPLDRFVRVMATAILTNPDIAKLEHTSVLTAMVQSAAMGLIPDGKQAAITPRNGKAVLVPMIQGYRDIAAKYGWTLRTAVVYDQDEFDHVVEDGDEKILHRPVRPGAERGELIASYAIAKHRDGRKIMTVLHPADIAHRRKSSSYDKVWNEHPAAMWEKSAGRDIFGQLGLAENDIVKELLRADALEQIDPEEATAALYGGRHALPSATHPEAAGRRPAEREDVSQQAGDVSSLSPESEASPAPGADDEPDLGGEPTTSSDEQEAIKLAADQAAVFHPPNGKHTAKSLSEIAKDPAGDGWLLNRLKVVNEPAAYRDALWAFCRVYKPELYEQAIAARNAS